MPAHRELDNLRCRKLIKDLFKKDMLYRQATKKYKISEDTLKKYIKRAIQSGIITRAQYDARSKRISSKSFEGKVFLYGDEEARKQCGDAGMDILSSLTETELRDMSKRGGDKTQKRYPKVAENLKNARSYSQRICNYGNFRFYSGGERFVAFLLVESGLLNNLVTGENFQKDFGNLNVDFYVPEKNVVIEYHPIPKNHRGIGASTLEAYIQERGNQLRKNGFNGKLIVIESIPDIHSTLRNARLTRISRKTYYKRYRKVVELLQDYDEHGKIDSRFKSLEAAVSQDDSVPESEDDPF